MEDILLGQVSMSDHDIPIPWFEKRDGAGFNPGRPAV